MSCCFARCAATRRRNDHNTPASPFLVPAFWWLDSQLPSGHLISSWGPSRPPVNGQDNAVTPFIHPSLHWLIYSFIYINLSLPLAITHSFTHSLPSLQNRRISEHAHWISTAILDWGTEKAWNEYTRATRPNPLSSHEPKWRLRQRWGWIFPVPITTPVLQATHFLTHSLILTLVDLASTSWLWHMNISCDMKEHF